MENEIKKGDSNFSKYYITEEFREVLKKAYQYKKIAKKAYLYIFLITIVASVLMGIIVNLFSTGNKVGYILGRNNRINNWKHKV